MAAKKSTEKKTKRKPRKSSEKTQSKQEGIYQATGKRKRAIAKATLKKGKGVIRINKKLLASLPAFTQLRIQEPLILAGDEAKGLDISVKVSGGGWQGQTEAARLAIGRALVNFNKKFKKVFAEYDRHLLLQDVRIKEARKPNDSRARASRQKSYR